MKQILLMIVAVVVVGCGPKKGGMEGTWATDEYPERASTKIVRGFITLGLDGSYSYTKVNLRRLEGVTGDMGGDSTTASTYYIKDGVIHVHADDWVGLKYLIRGDGNIEASMDYGYGKVGGLYKKQP